LIHHRVIGYWGDTIADFGRKLHGQIDGQAGTLGGALLVAIDVAEDILVACQVGFTELQFVLCENQDRQPGNAISHKVVV
jgi:hypothetical protein